MATLPRYLSAPYCRVFLIKLSLRTSTRSSAETVHYVSIRTPLVRPFIRIVAAIKVNHNFVHRSAGPTF